MKDWLIKFLLGFKYAFSGILETIKKERNIKVHIFVMLLVIIAGLYFKISLIEWFICIILFSIVISGEIFNTAIENLVDLVCPEKNEKAKIIKDASAGGVLILAIGSAIIGLIIFVPKIL